MDSAASAKYNTSVNYVWFLGWKGITAEVTIRIIKVVVLGCQLIDFC
jgi:hypothetical protein